MLQPEVHARQLLAQSPQTLGQSRVDGPRPHAEVFGGIGRNRAGNVTMLIQHTRLLQILVSEMAREISLRDPAGMQRERADAGVFVAGTGFNGLKGPAALLLRIDSLNCA
jgi:hypothetical protein